MVYSDQEWKPTTIKRVGRSEETSTGVTQVQTDAGWAYCKPIGNRQGEQVLACEWVSLRLARWIGLPTFKAAVIDLDDDATFPLPDHDGQKYHSKAGPCFVTQSTPGRKWDRSVEDLNRLINPGDLTALVVLDTWILNRDRHYPDYKARKPNHGNVYLAATEQSPEKFRLVAMDHTHCFDNGQLHLKTNQIDAVKDEKVYGLFPEFRPLVGLITLTAVLEKLKVIEKEMVEPMIAEVPGEWQVDAPVREKWVDLIVSRAHFLVDHLPAAIQSTLDAPLT